MSTEPSIVVTNRNSSGFLSNSALTMSWLEQIVDQSTVNGPRIFTQRLKTNQIKQDVLQSTEIVILLYNNKH